jgi:cytochrome P450
MFAVPRRPSPPTRNGLSFYTSPFDQLPGMLVRDTHEAGEVLRYWTPFFSMYFFDHPATIEEIFVTKARSFQKGRGVQRLRPLLGRGLLTAEQPEHLKNRRLAQPAFHRRRVDAYGPEMVAAAERRIAAWSDGGEIVVERETNRIALEIASRTLFGDDLSEAEMRDISAGLELTMAMIQFAIVPFSEVLDHLPIPTTRRFQRGKALLHGVVDRMIERGRARGDRGDLLSMLLSSRYEDGSRMSDEHIRDESVTILLAGHETTANAMAWTLELFGRHPEIEARVRAELASVLDGRAPSHDDVPNLPLLRACVAEAMRLYPPAWLIGRRAIEDVELHGYTIPKRHIVFASPFVTHRNPKYYSDPERFDPDRWLRAHPTERFAYFPFGGGNRLCIGESFAWFESTMVLATLLQGARFEPLDDAPIPLAPSITLRPGAPIRRRVTKLRSPRAVALA